MVGNATRSASDLNLPEDAEDLSRWRELAGILRDPLRVELPVAVRNKDAYSIEPCRTEGVASKKRSLRMPCGVCRGDKWGSDRLRRLRRKFGVDDQPHGFMFGKASRPRDQFPKPRSTARTIGVKKNNHEILLLFVVPRPNGPPAGRSRRHRRNQLPQG